MSASRAHDVIAVICASCVYLLAGLHSVNGLLMTEILNAFEADEVLASWIVSLYMGMLQFSGYLGGVFTVLYGGRAVTLTGVILAFSGYLLSALVTHEAWFFLTHSLLSGAGSGLFLVPSQAVPSQVTTKHTTLANSAVMLGGGMAYIVFPLVFDIFRECYGYRGALALCAAILLNAVPLAVLMTSHQRHVIKTRRRVKGDENNMNGTSPSIPNDCHDGYLQAPITSGSVEKIRKLETSLDVVVKSPDEGKDHPDERGAMARHVFREVLAGFQELRHPAALCSILVILFCGCGITLGGVFIPMKGQLMGLRKSKSAHLLMLMGVSDLVTRAVVGALCSAFPVSTPVVYGCSMLVISGGHLAVVFMESYGQLRLCFIATGAGIGCFYSLVNSAVLDAVGRAKLVRMMGLISLAYCIAFLISASTAGALYKATGSINAPFVMATVVALIAACIQLVFRFSPVYAKRPGRPETVKCSI